MNTILDNPAWNALISGNNALSNGNGQAKYFAPDVSPFVGLEENTPDNFKILHAVIPFDGYFALVSPKPINIPLPWRVLDDIKCLQMVCDTVTERIADNCEIVPLKESHVPAMLDLTKLTNPGPFAQRTIEFGHYRGIFDGDKLVAMAGQRMNPVPFAEISAVCTHPDHLGKGYAGKLIIDQVKRIKAASGIPFLHVRSENTRAINVYKSLGFASRKEINIYIMQKSSGKEWGEV